VRVTSTGHAGLLLETSGGTILCDPWFTPAFFGSWYPFPRNDDVDIDRISRPDYLYVSHAHRDHLDLDWLHAHIDPDTVVLLPHFGVDHLERLLAGIGFHRFVRTHDRQTVELDSGLRIAVISLAAPNIGPMGDSALLVADTTATVINQNDAHPHEIGRIDGFEHFDGHFLQHSGAIWYPMVYELPPQDEAHLIAVKRQRQLERACEFVDMVGATHVFPTAGPPCFLDDDLFELNDLPDGRPSIFPDATHFLAELGRRGIAGGHLLVPGSTAELDDGRCEVTHPVDDAQLKAIFTDKRTYLRRYQADMRGRLEAERTSWPTDRTDIVAELRQWIEPLLADAPHTRKGVGGAIGIDAGDERVVLDVPAGVVRRWADGEDDPPFVFRFDRRLLEAEVGRREPDWCNHLFLSCRFSASRSGPYNEYVYTFFKSLSPERMAYAERWYAAQQADADISWVDVDGWTVEHRCPHQRASLARMGSVCDGVLTCALHGFRYELPSGRCLDAEGVYLRVRGRTADLPATSIEDAEA
jgi:UDP-MurNAc hydroxylase